MLKLADYKFAFAEAHFEFDQEFNDSPEMRNLLNGYDKACREFNRNAGNVVMELWPEGSKEYIDAKRTAVHWGTVKQTLEVLIGSMSTWTDMDVPNQLGIRR